MKNKILHKSQQIEHEKGVTLLYAVESGSRAWGLPRPIAIMTYVLYTATIWIITSRFGNNPM